MVEDKNHSDYPAAPDLGKVDELRTRLRSDRAETRQGSGGPESRLNRKVAKSAKDIGTYTLIPSLMVAGPVVGFLVGRGLEKYIGGEPWGAIGGLLFGVVAAFRQIFLLLNKANKKN